MTVPEERTRAVVRTRDFLRELTGPLATPRVPRQVRNRAAALLRHFPQDFHLERAAHHCPESWGRPGEHLEFSNVGRRYPKPKVKSLDAFAGSLQAIRHVKIEQMSPLRDRNVEQLLTSIASSPKLQRVRSSRSCSVSAHPWPTNCVYSSSFCPSLRCGS